MSAERFRLPPTPDDPGDLPDLGGLRVLLVEDNERLRHIMQRSLTSLGCQVSVAADAAQAMQLMQQAAPQLLLSDIRMPGEMDGFGLASWALAHCPATRVLLQSGYVNAPPAEFAKLSKPFTLEELSAAIRTAMI